MTYEELISLPEGSVIFYEYKYKHRITNQIAIIDIASTIGNNSYDKEKEEEKHYERLEQGTVFFYCSLFPIFEQYHTHFSFMQNVKVLPDPLTFYENMYPELFI